MHNESEPHEWITRMVCVCVCMYGVCVCMYGVCVYGMCVHVFGVYTSMCMHVYR